MNLGRDTTIISLLCSGLVPAILGTSLLDDHVLREHYLLRHFSNHFLLLCFFQPQQIVLDFVQLFVMTEAHQFFVTRLQVLRPSLRDADRRLCLDGCYGSDRLAPGRAKRSFLLHALLALLLVLLN